MPEQAEPDNSPPSDSYGIVYTGSGEVRDADGNLLNQPEPADESATDEGES